MANCNFVRSVFHEFGDVVCCLSGMGMIGELSHTSSISLGDSPPGLARPPTICEMLPTTARNKTIGLRRLKHPLPFSDTPLLDELLKDRGTCNSYVGSSSASVSSCDSALSRQLQLAEEDEEALHLGFEPQWSLREPAYAGSCEVVAEPPSLQTIYYSQEHGLVEYPANERGMLAASVWYVVAE
eukprot:TRINITY_DN13315_c0_g1_i1.p1 TRINITY_DN13315_c0_g1~~TRINITY_DN13315_c0_g1_i1.p1  ORF type:complete len:205 (+),score=37.31 TRINITY_DN13315_c0_g1_i1:66-617(+)